MHYFVRCTLYIRVPDDGATRIYQRKSMHPAASLADAVALQQTLNRMHGADISERHASVVVSVYISGQGKVIIPIDDLENVARDLQSAADELLNDQRQGKLMVVNDE